MIESLRKEQNNHFFSKNDPNVTGLTAPHIACDSSNGTKKFPVLFVVCLVLVSVVLIPKLLHPVSAPSSDINSDIVSNNGVTPDESAPNIDIYAGDEKTDETETHITNETDPAFTEEEATDNPADSDSLSDDEEENEHIVYAELEGVTYSDSMLWGTYYAVFEDMSTLQSDFFSTIVVDGTTIRLSSFPIAIEGFPSDSPCSAIFTFFDEKLNEVRISGTYTLDSEGWISFSLDCLVYGNEITESSFDGTQYLVVLPYYDGDSFDFKLYTQVEQIRYYKYN